MNAHNTQTRLLFGLLALQFDFLSVGDLRDAIAAGTGDDSRSFPDTLVSEGHLSESDCLLLESLVARHLRQHGDDPARSLSALPPLSDDAAAAFDGQNDSDLQAALDLVPRIGPRTQFDDDGRYRTIVEESVQPIAIHQNHHFCYANPAFANMLGFDSPADVMGRMVFETLARPDEWPLMRTRTTAALRGEPVAPHPGWWGTRQDGSLIRISATASQIIWRARPAVVSFFSDITARYESGELHEQTQREAEESLALLDTLQETAPVGFAFVDCELRYERINETLALINGMPAEQHIGRTIGEVLPDLAPHIEHLHRQVLETGEPIVNLEINAPQPSDLSVMGTWLASYYPVENGGKMLGVGVVIVEITERKRIEEALRDADRRKDEFLAMLSHELRNPLAPIRSSVDILRLEPLRNERLERARDIIDSQVDHLVHIVDDLLDVSRITRGQIHLNRQRVNTETIVRDAIAASRPLIDSRNHDLSVSLPEVPAELDADSTRLVQVLTNLLNNAARYAEPGGHIELTAARESSALMLSVRDDGVGISEDLLPHVFDLFVQSDRSLDRSNGGLGIGLTVAKRLVEMHGGSIAASSRGVGQGSEFTVRLPLAEHAEIASSTPNAASVVTHAQAALLKILIVDDNETVVESASMLLEILGHEPHAAFDGQSALKLAAEIRPDVCLIDIGLPGMNGYELVRKLNELPEIAGTLMIAVSGYGRESDIERARSAGFDQHLLKPADIDQIREILSQAQPRAADAK